MKRFIALSIVLALVVVLMPTAAFAGVEPSPFMPPGKAKLAWTPPGQLVGFDPQPNTPMFAPKGQLVGFDPQPEPPGKLLGEWTPPGQIYMFDPQPEPPGHTPIMQMLDIVVN
jgi:hypothetical protein